MSILFKSITAVLICSLCSLILISSSANLVTSLFLVSSVLKTLNDISTGLVLICFSLTNCLLIPICIYLKSTSAWSHNSLLFYVLILACIFSSLFVIPSVRNNILILSLSYISSLYYAYLGLSPKPYSLSSFSMSVSFWILQFFIFCPDLQSLVMYPIFLYL